VSYAIATEAASSVARETIARHSRSFALASALLGRRLRDQTAVVYTWCRRADDAVDIATDRGDAARALDVLRCELDDVYSGAARDPVLAAFADVVRTRAIPRAYPAALLDGMAMDVADTRYATFDELLAYCWRVAGVVGLMMSHVFGISDDRALVRAAHLGIAMQLTNICRDVAEDWSRGRLYLPDELLAEHGANGLRAELGSPLRRSAIPAIGDVVRELLIRADRYYRSGDRGIAALPWRAALAVRAARSVYAAIGARIARAKFDVAAGRAVVPGARKVALVTAAIGRIALSAPNRAARVLAGRRATVPVQTLELGDVTLP
jgi:15-cis-phytoene synthase